MSVEQNLFSGRAREFRRPSKIHMGSVDAMKIARAKDSYLAHCRYLLRKYPCRFVSQHVDESLGISVKRFEIHHWPAVKIFSYLLGWRFIVVRQIWGPAARIVHKSLLRRKNPCAKVKGSYRKIGAASVADVVICPAKSMRANLFNSGVTV